MKTVPKLYPPFMSLPGVYEDMEVPDAPRDGVRKEGVFIRN